MTNSVSKKPHVHYCAGNEVDLMRALNGWKGEKHYLR